MERNSESSDSDPFDTKEWVSDSSTSSDQEMESDEFLSDNSLDKHGLEAEEIKEPVMSKDGSENGQPDNAYEDSNLSDCSAIVPMQSAVKDSVKEQVNVTANTKAKNKKKPGRFCIFVRVQCMAESLRGTSS
ncbi:uncharacterized protein LOC123532205 isoform X2 [Mercenaria mercenaria]|uniref:uncharacterized protein LOC123532205 isoform X2 n=1 Tax=Mercenaria mercenaria TaxID=6596 RepID=UPI00234FA0F3|nr:uncharacterized protein LOC123532205 isoform X2 [Mercenaria mercenaria]